MAAVLLREPIDPALLPAVDVKSGEPTFDQTHFVARARRPWTLFLLVLGVLPYLLVSAFTATKREVVLPLARESASRYRRLRLAANALICISLLATLACGVATTPGPRWFVAAGTVALSVVARCVVQLRLAPGALLQPRRSAVLITRCHASFAAAVTDAGLTSP